MLQIKKKTYPFCFFDVWLGKNVDGNIEDFNFLNLIHRQCLEEKLKCPLSKWWTKIGTFKLRIGLTSVGQTVCLALF